MREKGASTVRSERTICPFCSCGCGFYLRGTAGGMEGVGPSEHHAVSAGRLCVLGWSAHEASRWGPRLRTPLLRQDGELQPVSWEEALAAAADGLSRLRSAGRPLGVLVSGRSSNEESYLAVALARSALRTPHLDAGLRGQWDALLRGLGRVRQRPAPGEALARLESSDLVVLLEDDLSVTHPRVAQAVLRAVRRGARLVTVGWQRTPLATLASHHVPLDAAAPLATLAGLGVQAPLKAWLSAACRASFVLSPFDADPALLRAASACFSELAAGLSGGGTEPLLLPLPVRANTRGALDMGVAPDCLPGCRPLGDSEARASLRRVWGNDGCWDAGVDADGMAGVVAGLVVVGEELPAVHPSPARVREQLAAVEHHVVVDAFLTETAAAAHVVLPMAAFGEAEGTVTGVEGRAQVLRPFGPPPAGVRQGWEILAALMQALDSPYRVRTPAELRGAIAASVPGYESLGGPLPDDGWPVAWPEVEPVPAGGNGKGAAGADAPWPAQIVAAPGPHGSTGRGLLLRRVGAFDWGQDSLVRFSPTLRRDSASRARRFPQGLVAMCASDAGALGVRDGWMLRLRSPHGEARVALAVQDGLEPGMVLVPYAFREQLGAVLGAEGVAEVVVRPA